MHKAEWAFWLAGMILAVLAAFYFNPLAGLVPAAAPTPSISTLVARWGLVLTATPDPARTPVPTWTEPPGWGLDRRETQRQRERQTRSRL